MGVEMKEAYSYAELAEMWGLPYPSVSGRARDHNIPRFKVGKVSYIKAEDADRLKTVFTKFNGGKERRREEPKQNAPQTAEIYWRVSVYDARLCRYIVKRCSLTKEEAEFEQTVFELSGFVARASPCA